MNNERIKILAKLSKIQAEIEKMEKDGTNSFQNYKYLSETQITFKMKTLLDKHKLLFHYGSAVWDIQPIGTGGTILTTVTVHYAFIDTESGQELSGSAVGQGTDKGDKGVYKAITGAIKYIYMKTFNIPTGDDPENEKKTYTINSVGIKAAKEAVKDLKNNDEIAF